MKFMTGFFTSVREHGISNTLAIVKVKAKFLTELFLPLTIWGERVVLRSTRNALKENEIEQVYNLSLDEEMLKWSGGTPSQLSLEEFQKQITNDRWHLHSNQYLFYIVKRANEIIGRVGLYTIDWSKQEGEFGISIGRQYWNRRYGREATDLFLQYIFAKTPIKRIYLGTFQDNLRAQRSFAASGFRKIGTESHFLPSAGKYVEGIKMEITAQDLMK
jgi:RimJ/RimL family protein N-acetyltransferase